MFKFICSCFSLLIFLTIVNAFDINSFIKSLNLEKTLNANQFVSDLSSAASASSSSSSSQTSACANIETDTNYLNFILNYKDNVNSTSDCCDFCNANIRCIIWSLDLDLNRCWLKYDRGARISLNGVHSGFSNACKFTFSFFLIFFNSTRIFSSNDPIILIRSDPNFLKFFYFHFNLKKIKRLCIDKHSNVNDGHDNNG